LRILPGRQLDLCHIIWRNDHTGAWRWTLALSGANGSGKTTTIRMLCGLVKPESGGGTCFGLDLLNDTPRIRLQVGYMTQRFSCYEDLTVGQNLDFVAAV